MRSSGNGAKVMVGSLDIGLSRSNGPEELVMPRELTLIDMQLISSLVKISRVDNHQQRPTETQRLSSLSPWLRMLVYRSGTKRTTVDRPEPCRRPLPRLTFEKADPYIH